MPSKDHAAQAYKQKRNVSVKDGTIDEVVEVGNLQNPHPVDLGGTTVPLPSGAATEAKQDDVITGIEDLETSTSSTQLTIGGETVGVTYDLAANMALSEITKQLKIMNLHLSEISTQHFTEQDI